ncbi:MFS transporter [uncultured Bacteroides sp.]|uniref:MFS transporter n=1 Tax=uncultured Bacteroides sp. TaxID=162156 RepID=UPI002AA881BA|nr:MFS transporter [uncultured Bacteroides sp.]
MADKQFGKLSTFFSLYIAQSVPMSLFSTLLPVLMRQDNFSLTAIGMLQLIKLPWIVKFLWAPLVDRKTSGLGSYKRWIFSSEAVYAFLILMLAFLDLKADFKLVLLLIILSFIASATQDIATDGMTTLSFKKKERSRGNSMQSMGNFAGSLVGGGLLLILYKYTGWTVMLLGLSAFVLVMVLPLAFYHDHTFVSRAGRVPIGMKDLFLFFRQRRIGSQLTFLLLFNSGLIGTLAMMKPWLVDLGYPIANIGLMFSIFGSLCGCLGSYVSGYIIRRWGRGRAAALFAFCILGTTLLFFLLSKLGTLTDVSLYIGIFCLWCTYGLSTVLIYTVAMDYVRVGREGTDFTLQIVIMHLGSVIIAVGSGKLADKMGYSTLFVAEAALALLSFIYIWMYFKKILRV